MAEANGGARLDRIEAALEELTTKFDDMVEHHDYEFKQLLKWQVLMQENWERSQEDAARERRRLDTLYENTDKRIADLVSAINKLISARPPA